MGGGMFGNKKSHLIKNPESSDIVLGRFHKWL